MPRVRLTPSPNSIVGPSTITGPLTVLTSPAVFGVDGVPFTLQLGQTGPAAVVTHTIVPATGDTLWVKDWSGNNVIELTDAAIKITAVNSMQVTASTFQVSASTSVSFNTDSFVIGKDGTASTLTMGTVGAGASVVHTITTATGDSLNIIGSSGGYLNLSPGGFAPVGGYGIYMSADGAYLYFGTAASYRIVLGTTYEYHYNSITVKNAANALPLSGDNFIFGLDNSADALTGVRAIIRPANLTNSASTPNGLDIKTCTGPAGATAGYNRLLDASGSTRLRWDDYGVALHGEPMSWNTGRGVTFMGDCTVVPTAAPVSGVYVYVESGSLKAMSPSGFITTLCPA